MQNREQLYKYEGFLPLTRKQIIDYMKDGNQLTKRNGKFYLTGGIPVIKEVKGIQKVFKIIQKSYSGYDEYFDSLLREGIITKVFA